MAIDIHRATTPQDLAGARELILTSLHDDQGYGFQPQWHWDLDHLTEVYVDNPRQAMVVAVDEGTVVGTCAARIGGSASPPHPAWLADHYADRANVVQLVRLVTDPRLRRKASAAASSTPPSRSSAPRAGIASSTSTPTPRSPARSSSGAVRAWSRPMTPAATRGTIVSRRSTSSCPCTRPCPPDPESATGGTAYGPAPSACRRPPPDSEESSGGLGHPVGRVRARKPALTREIS